MTNNVTTGISGGIKRDAINATAENAKQQAADKVEIAKKVENAPVNTLIYKTMGEPVFNCIIPQRIRISFIAGMYVLEPTDKNYKAIEKGLEYFVEQGQLTKEVKK